MSPCSSRTPLAQQIRLKGWFSRTAAQGVDERGNYYGVGLIMRPLLHRLRTCNAPRRQECKHRDPDYPADRPSRHVNLHR